jgi:hypothetical protein
MAPCAVVRNGSRGEHRFRARVGLAALYLLVGLLFFLALPFIRTSRVPSELSMLVLMAWALGLILLPVVGHRSAERLVYVLAGGMVAYLVVAVLVAGGLTAPSDY